MRPKSALARTLVAVGFLAAAGCAAPARAPRQTATPAPHASSAATPLPVHVSGVGRPSQPTVLTQTVHGRLVYTIRALAFNGDIGGARDGRATLEQPHITFVDKAGTTTIADAPKATVTQRDKSVVMTGGVHARTSDRIVMTCDTLRYDGGTERFHGRGHVVLVGPSGLALAGNYLDGDVRLRDVSVTKDSPK